MFGYEPGEFEGKSSRATLRSDEDFARIGRELADSVAAGKLYVAESLSVRKDGSTFWCRKSATVLAAGDTSQGVVILYEDITAQKAAAEADRGCECGTGRNLQFGKRRHCPDPRRPHRTLQQRPRTYARIRAWNDAGHGQCRAVRAQGRVRPSEPEVNATLARGETYSSELLFQRRDGSTFWGHLTGRAIDPVDPASARVWMLADVTAEHAAAEELRTVNERLNLAQEAGGVGIFDTNVTAGQTYWTPQLERMFGVEPGQLDKSPDSWIEFLHPDDREGAIQRFKQAVATALTSC